MNRDQWLHYTQNDIVPFAEIGKNWALKPHKQLSDAFRNASQVYKNFIDVVIKTSHSAIKTICFIEMDFTEHLKTSWMPVFWSIKMIEILRYSREKVGHFTRIVIFQMSLFVKVTINVLENKMF